jgi:uncharacterized protein
MLRLLTPNLRVRCVTELSVERLRGLGLKALLLDVDCTLTRYRSHDVPAEVVAWTQELRAAGVGLCLVSNGLGSRIGPIASRLGLPYVAKAMKPLPSGCQRAVGILGSALNETALVGDQLFTDVAAARLARLTAILVQPLHPEDEPWYTRLKRPLERLLLRSGGEQT